MVDFTGYTPLVDKLWKQELGEMAQLVKCLLHKHGALTSVKPPTVMSTSNSSSAEARGALGFAGQSA